MDRRSFLATSATVALLPLTEAPALAAVAAKPGAGDAKLNALFEDIFQERVRNSPELASSLGLDKGPNAALKSKLDTRPAAVARREDLARNRRAIARLNGVSPATLSDPAKLNREVVLYSLDTSTVAAARWDIDSAQRPYPITQQGGAYFQVPDFLNTAHTINGAADAEAYLSRLGQFATVLDNDTADQRAQAARGFLAPAWSIDLALGQMRKLRSPAPEQNSMVQSLAKRAAAKGIAGDWQRRASGIVAQSVYPALDRQMATMEQLKPTTRPGDGAWRLNDGEAIYAEALHEATTTNFTPAEVHQMGLDQVADITRQLDQILKSQGYTQGSVSERLGVVSKNPAQVYPDSDAGRAELLAYLNQVVKDMYTRLPQAFDTLPNQPLEIRRVPPEIQDGASNGYYNRAALDGSRPAIYFINLKDMGDWPKFTLPTLCYHEGVPGHHLQISITQESQGHPDAEEARLLLGLFGGLGALCRAARRRARRLCEGSARPRGLPPVLPVPRRAPRRRHRHPLEAVEPRAGDRLHGSDHRLCAPALAARGRALLHDDRAGVQLQGRPHRLDRARAEAQKTLGAKFDLKRFHEVLREGAMPLSILERRIRERTAVVA